MKFALFLSLFAVVCFSFCCKKQTLGSQYTSKMGGVRYWTGSSSYFGWNFYHPTSPGDTSFTTNIKDTFAIDIINGASIAILGDTINFTSSHNSVETITFGETTNNGFNSDILVYYYGLDSIAYTWSNRTSAAADSWGNLTTP